MEGGLPSPAGGFLPGKAGIVLPSLVEELVGAVRQVTPREYGNCVDDPAALSVCFLGWSGLVLRSVGARPGQDVRHHNASGSSRLVSHPSEVGKRSEESRKLPAGKARPHPAL